MGKGHQTTKNRLMALHRYLGFLIALLSGIEDLIAAGGNVVTQTIGQRAAILDFKDAADC